MGGAGLLGAYLVGCADGDQEPSATATPVPGEPTATTPPDAWRWRQLAPSGALPPPRHDHSLVTDGQRLYLFGGRNPQPLDDLWEFDIDQSQWNNKLQANQGPPARFGHNAIWDPTQNRVVIFGGQAGGEFFNDVWEFDPAASQWTQVVAGASAPASRYGAAAAFDGAGHFIVTHGFTTEGRFDDTWQLDLAGSAWTDMSPTEGDRPVERCLMRGVWDSLKQRFLMFGGQTTDTPFLGDLWAWSATRGWAALARTPAPSPRNFYAMVFDGERAQAILVGGRTEEGATNDVWTFHAGDENWTQAAPEGEAPSARYGHDAALVSPGSILLFGGTDNNAEFNDLWELSPA